MLRALLYGKADRHAKARGRIGLAMIAFTAVFAIIAGRLVLYAMTPDSHGGAARQFGDAIATARPDILDRNGEVLATDVKAAIAVRRAEAADRRRRGGRAAHRRDAGPRRQGSARAARQPQARLRLAQARDQRRSSSRKIYRLGIPGIGFLNENKRTYPNGAEVAHLIGLVNVDNQGIAGIEKWLDGNGLAALHAAGLATDRLQEPVQLAVDLRVQHAMRDELIAARDKFKARSRRRRHHRRAHRRDPLDGVGAGFRPEQSEGGERSDPDQSPDHRRVRDGLDLQGADARDGTRLRQVHAQLDARCARLAALRQVQHQRLSRAAPRADPAGGVHLFVQHRHRQDRARPGRRAPQVVPAEDGPARPAHDRAARERDADRAEALGRAQHHHDRVRPRPLGRAAAGHHGGRRADERRRHDPADIPEAQRGRSAGSWPCR